MRYRPWDRKELDRTDRLTLSLSGCEVGRSQVISVAIAANVAKHLISEFAVFR